jgi:hypothetical protein
MLGSEEVVSVGGAAPRAGAFADLSEEELDPEAAASLQKALEDAAGDNGVTATLMTADGTWTGATGTADGVRAMSPEAQMAIGSITKTITAAQVMQLVEAGTHRRVRPARARGGRVDRIAARAEDAVERKLDAPAAEQKAGAVGGALPADQLFALVLTLIHGAADAHVASANGLTIQRDTLVSAVRQLTPSG